MCYGENENSVNIMPYVTYTEKVSEFLDTLNDINFIIGLIGMTAKNYFRSKPYQ